VAIRKEVGTPESQAGTAQGPKAPDGPFRARRASTSNGDRPCSALAQWKAPHGSLLDMKVSSRAADGSATPRRDGGGLSCPLVRLYPEADLGSHVAGIGPIQMAWTPPFRLYRQPVHLAAWPT
jgi:hypothetical protein